MLKNIIILYLKEKGIDVYDRSFNLKNSIKNLTDILYRINMKIAKYMSNKEIEL